MLCSSPKQINLPDKVKGLLRHVFHGQALPQHMILLPEMGYSVLFIPCPPGDKESLLFV